VKAEFCTALPPILGDANQLEKAFLNIVINAGMPCRAAAASRCHARGPATERHRRVGRASQPGVEVVIADTGMGIAGAHAQDLRPVLQAPRGRKGTGLGWLSVAASSRTITAALSGQRGRPRDHVHIWLPAGRSKHDIARAHPGGGRRRADAGPGWPRSWSAGLRGVRLRTARSSRRSWNGSRRIS